MATGDTSPDMSPVEDITDSDNEPDLTVKRNASEIFQKDVSTLTVGDVYSIAGSVGKEFEKLTDAFGGAIFSDVMPKMIRILEMLEAFAARSQNFSTDVVQLQAEVQKLQIDKKSNSEKHMEEMEMVEVAWREEMKELLHTVESLREDNQKLTHLLTEKLEDPASLDKNSNQQGSVLSVIGESVEKQRQELQEKNRLIEQGNSEIEALNSQVNRLTKLNVDIRRKLAVLEHQSITLAAQNSDQEKSLLEKDKQVSELKKRVVELKRKSEDLGKEEMSTFTDSASCETDEWPGDPLLANKLVIDLNDPDRPRYTLHEMQEVLNERNRFKLKCLMQAEELKMVNSEDQWEMLEENEISSASQPTASEEVNNNKPESAIKKLFTSIFSRNPRSPTIPRMVQEPKPSQYVRFDIPLCDFEEVLPNPISALPVEDLEQKSNGEHLSEA